MKKNLFIAGLLFSIGSFSQSTSYFFARTTGEMPFFEYGIGDDRLGGAKMTYLDSNILVKIVDSFKTDYIVQLSKNHTAYIDKKSVVREPSVKDKIHLSGSWKVYGDSLFDYINVSLDEKLPYRSFQQINPSKVIVEIFGTQTNTNWITQLSTTKEIKNTWYQQQEDDVMRLIIELKHKQHWGYNISYEGNKLIIKIKRQPAIPQLKYLTIAVDAGHGGDNTGADGITSKILEKNYTLLIAKQLKAELLKKNAHVFMTREKDTSLSMPERTEMLKKANPDMLISIHLNSASKDSVQGVSTYYRYIGFRPLSTYILKHMLQLSLKEYGNIGAFNFSLSGPTDYPNCLVEVAFLSNKQDEKKILSPAFRKAAAKKIIEGIEEFLKNL